MNVSIRTSTVGKMTVSSEQIGPWSVSLSSRFETRDVEIVTLSLSSPSEAVPPSMGVYFEFPLDGIRCRWIPFDDQGYLPPNWDAPVQTDIARSIPLCALIGLDDRSRLTMAFSEAGRFVEARIGVHEANSLVSCYMTLFTQPEAPLSSYKAELRLDRRGLLFHDSIREASDWLTSLDPVPPCTPPAAAFEPLYSSWYGFHKDLFAKEVEEECAAAGPLGMKVLILDDGWQEDEHLEAYAHCGDWKVVPRRIPDMRAHVEKVHECGLKYMLWFALPLVGHESAAFQRFKGKMLYSIDALGASVFDPRFPEVRDYLASIFEKAVLDWDLDGFKIDFVNTMTAFKEDPAIADNFAGRDIRSVPDAIDALLAEIMRRAKAIKPDLLVEFRQPYISPVIRKYGNMIRASDCPANVRANRIRTINLRLTSGGSAVHADMLEWHVGETAEDAAQQVLAVLFSVIQYSMRLKRLPESHLAMIRHWIAFTQAHRETLLHGVLRPRSVAEGYPVVESEGKGESIYAVYSRTAVCAVSKTMPVVYIVNATTDDSLCVDLPGMPRSVEAFDTFGRSSKTDCGKTGLQRLPVPKSGYLRVCFG